MNQLTNQLMSYFKVDAFSLFIGGFALFFYLLTRVYSLSFMRGRPGITRYNAYLFLTLISSWGAIFANHLIVFLVFWGFLGLLLYLLISFGQNERVPATAQKAMIIIGGSDALMILGLALIYHLSGSLNINEIHLGTDNKLALLAFICLACGALAKAGSMPFHSWIPDTAQDAPIPVTAYLPASLDKLLGIYFLARLTLTVFKLTPGLQTVLMMVGSITIVAAVMMALIQHDLKRLLGYHAVSQVGYMVLGIGTGIPVGIAGGLFHMLNHAIYKSCLFFCAGAVEKETGTTNLDKLGGLAKTMPITFISFLVAALAISGVPPLNGFASKWMIFQGVIETAHRGGHLWVLWLLAAMIGSAFTLASFMKVVHAVFLGQASQEEERRVGIKRETKPLMWIPMVVLAFLCLLFGLFAKAIPLDKFIFPSMGYEAAFPGVWNSSIATLLLVGAVFIGFLIFLMGTIMKTRRTEAFVGGERLQDHPEMRVSGTDFYHTIQDMRGLKGIYNLAEKKQFDPYEVGIREVSRLTNVMKILHNGILPTYLAWVLLGAAILMLVLMV